MPSDAQNKGLSVPFCDGAALRSSWHGSSSFSTASSSEEPFLQLPLCWTFTSVTWSQWNTLILNDNVFWCLLHQCYVRFFLFSQLFTEVSLCYITDPFHLCWATVSACPAVEFKRCLHVLFSTAPYLACLLFVFIFAWLYVPSEI
jgi:hypothetical protein